MKEGFGKNVKFLGTSEKETEIYLKNKRMILGTYRLTSDNRNQAIDFITGELDKTVLTN